MNHKFLFSISTLGLLAGITQPTLAQTFYQCMPCSSDEKWYGGKCYSYNSENNYEVTANPSASNCSSGVLYPGYYIVFLRGGKGGSSSQALGGWGGEAGGNLRYQFTLYSSVFYQLCAGGNGASDSVMSGGGGAGSWLKLDDAYLVAGGGGGGGVSNNAWGQAGAGGAVGAGGGSDCNSDSNGAIGGSVGSYSAASKCAGSSKTGGWGDGINDNNKGRGGHNGASTAAEAKGINLYSGAIRTKVGGTPNTSGSATHNSNTTLNFACDSPYSGCAKLYKFKY